MIDKPKRRSGRWSVLAIEAMLVLVALITTLNAILPVGTVSEANPVEPAINVPQAVVVPANLPTTSHLVEQAYNAALDYLYQQDYYKARNLLESIVETDPHHYWAHVSLSYVLYELGDYNQAIELATQAIALNPADSAGLNNRCLLRAYLGDYQGALDDCNQSISLSPDYDFSYNNRCYIYIQLGELEQAYDDCSQALIHGHRMPEWVYTNLGDIYRLRGQEYAAIDAYVHALSINPHYADAYARMGDIMMVHGCYDLAISMYTRYEAEAGVHYRPIYGEKLEQARQALAKS